MAAPRPEIAKAAAGDERQSTQLRVAVVIGLGLHDASQLAAPPVVEALPALEGGRRPEARE